MLIVNQGLDGEYFIFRGSDAAEFLKGLDLLGSREVLVVLPDGRKERGRFAVTVAKTALLVLVAENISDTVASIAFDFTRDAYMRRVGADHESN